MKLIPLIVAVLLLSLAIPACKKEEPKPLPTNSEKILGTWTLTEQLHNQNGQFVSVLYACDLDDTWTFNMDGTLTGSQSGTTCDPGSPPGFTTKWELQDDETVLYLDFVATFDKFKIAILNDTVLVLHRPVNFDDINGPVYAKVTYKR